MFECDKHANVIIGHRGDVCPLCEALSNQMAMGNEIRILRKALDKSERLLNESKGTK